MYLTRYDDSNSPQEGNHMNRNKEITTKINHDFVTIIAKQEVRELGNTGKFYFTQTLTYGWTNYLHQGTVDTAVVGRVWNTEAEAVAHADEFFTNKAVIAEVRRNIAEGFREFAEISE